MGVGEVGAEEAKEARVVLDDGTAFTASGVHVLPDQVLMALPRERVASVNGEPLPEAISTGAVAPDFTGVDLKGASHRLSDQQGRIVLIKFWATWCPHCRADIGLMNDLFTRYQEQGVSILALSVDQNVEQLERFAREHAMRYPVIAVYGQPKGQDLTDLPERYDMQGVPNYVLVGADGVIVKRIAGSITESNYDIERDLNELLAARPVRVSRAP
ncbi:MAG: redoxin domain-containing protein [Candidatus Omnitrophica bacterium]|nr:redoxin domain-containing protein [Candidatus Omnitrophota bacterium]